MSNILVPVDGSDSSLRAAKLAIELSRRREGTQLHLVNVQLPIRADEMGNPETRALITRAHEMASETALRSARALLSASGVGYSAQGLVGEIAQSIVQHAKEQGCDGIVMGTRGSG